MTGNSEVPKPEKSALRQLQGERRPERRTCRKPRFPDKYGLTYWRARKRLLPGQDPSRLFRYMPCEAAGEVARNAGEILDCARLNRLFLIVHASPTTAEARKALLPLVGGKFMCAKERRRDIWGFGGV